MPSRAILDRRDAIQAEKRGALDPNVCVVLKPDFTCFKVPQTELRKEMWGRVCVQQDDELHFEDFQQELELHDDQPLMQAPQTVTSSLSETRPILFLDQFHPAFFAFFALYLNHQPLFPFVDLAFRFTGYEAAMQFDDFTQSDEVPIVAMSLLADTANDHRPYDMSTARQLLFAYFMGQKLGVPHFQDAIMNAITKFFRADGPPSPPFIVWVYRNCAAGQPIGIKKFFVDFYIWAANFDPAQIPRLSEYIPTFQHDVKVAFAATKQQVIIDKKDPQRRMEQVDIVVDFMKLQATLCDGRQGRLKCRYHQHGKDQLCFNLIVDDGAPVPG